MKFDILHFIKFTKKLKYFEKFYYRRIENIIYNNCKLEKLSKITFFFNRLTLFFNKFTVLFHKIVH